jgi:dTDP-4-dehydrorhamnose reductase
VKIVLLGKDGQVGWELQRSLAPLGEVIALGRAEADLENPAGLLEKLHAIKPTVIVNAAAYTAVDRAETDVDRAQLINAAAPAALASFAAESGAWLIHYSTDYVFDGTKAVPYVEDDVTGPLSVYGRSKLDGERAVVGSACRHLIFRTSWVFAARGGNFARTMLKLASERDRLSVVNDQFGAPTSAELIADVTALCLYRVARDEAWSAAGIYNLVAAGETSWFEYAKLVLSEAESLGVALKVKPDAVLPIPASDYPTPARRPSNSRLSTDKLRAAFGLELPDWRFHVRRMVQEIVAR